MRITKAELYEALSMAVVDLLPSIRGEHGVGANAGEYPGDCPKCGVNQHCTDSKYYKCVNNIIDNFINSAKEVNKVRALYLK